MQIWAAHPHGNNEVEHVEHVEYLVSCKPDVDDAGPGSAPARQP